VGGSRTDIRRVARTLLAGILIGGGGRRKDFPHQTDSEKIVEGNECWVEGEADVILTKRSAMDRTQEGGLRIKTSRYR